MSIPFTSSEHFKNETMALSRHTKPMKVSALRLAMAKHAGFSSVQAYMTHLDQRLVKIPEASKEDTRRATLIARQGDVIMLQAESTLEQGDFDYIDDWNDMVEKHLIGQNAFGLQEISQCSMNGVNVVSGFLDVTDEEVLDQIPEIVAHFCEKNNSPSWPMGDMAEQHLMSLIKGFFDVASEQYNMLAEGFAKAKGKPLSLEHFSHAIREIRIPVMNYPELVLITDMDQAQAVYGFSEYDLDCAVKAARTLGVMESVCESHAGELLLRERIAAMLTTLITLVLEDEPGTYSTPKDFVCGIQDVIMSHRGRRNRQTVKASFFTNQVYRVIDGQVVDLYEGV